MYTDWLNDILRCPQTLKPLKHNGDNYESDGKVYYEKNNILSITYPDGLCGDNAKFNKLYFYSTFLLILILPVLSIIIDYLAFNQEQKLIFLTGKWFIFWSICLRQIIAGFKQVVQPAFTLEKIFNI